MEDLKVKPLTKEQIIISVDRLTRFKDTETKYLRVFKDILVNNLISPKFKKADLEKMNTLELKNLAEYIINYSLGLMGKTLTSNFEINQKLFNYEKSVFSFGEDVENLLKNKINYPAILDFIDNNSPKNLQWLKALKDGNDTKAREENSLEFPVEKVVIVEGATEETLLPVFGQKCGYDFDKEGVYVLPAGGKNQVVKVYYEMSEKLKLPIFVLLDKDAKENLEEIKPKLRPKDKIHLLDSGEFEDLLPINLVLRTLEYELKNISILEKEMLNEVSPRVKFLEEVFKTRGMHEFKKVEFAQMVKQNITSDNDISPEITQIIREIEAIS